MFHDGIRHLVRRTILRESLLRDWDRHGPAEPVAHFRQIQRLVADPCVEGVFHAVHDRIADEVHDQRTSVLCGEYFMAQGIDGRALFVHHVIVFKRALADGEMLLLDALLGLFNGTGQQRMGEFLPFLQAKTLHQPGNPVRAEKTHQIVLQRNIETGRTRVALA